MAGLDFLFNGAPPSSVTSSTANSTQGPDWYQEYVRGIAGKATQVAGQPYQAYPGQRVAGFTPDQRSAFDTVRGGVGAWDPAYQGALTSANNIAPAAYGALGTGADFAAQGAGQAQQWAGQAANSASTPAQTWDTSYQKYMSPYTSGVVNEIGRLGNQNLMENILPNVQSQFVGAGQFGSSRNADILGRSIRDAQAGISGQQAQALEQGWNTNANIFGQDANRGLTQQQNQAQTAIQAGHLTSGASGIAGQLANSGAQIGAAAGDSSAQRLGALSTIGQTLNTNDATALGAIGGAQQGLNQTALNTGYQDFLDQQNWDKNNLNFVNGALRGTQIPTINTQVSNGPAAGAGYNPAPLAWLSSLYGQNKAAGQP